MKARAALSIVVSLLALLPSLSGQNNSSTRSNEYQYVAPTTTEPATISPAHRADPVHRADSVYENGHMTSVNEAPGHTDSDPYVIRNRSSAYSSEHGGNYFNGPPSHNRGNGRRSPDSGDVSPRLSERDFSGLTGNHPPDRDVENTLRSLYELFPNATLFVIHRTPNASRLRVDYSDTIHSKEYNFQTSNDKVRSYPRGPDRECRNDEFRCGSNECVPASVRCDNKTDCRDSSDEESCFTNRNQEDGCVLPEQPEGGRYTVGGCGEPCYKNPGDIVPKNTILTYNCTEKYFLKGNTASFCLNKNWYAPPSCVRICSALRSTSVDISCSYRGDTVSCTERVLPGTQARLSCKSSHTLHITNDPGYREIMCVNDGYWNRPLFRCLSECGISTLQGSPTIVNGSEAKVGTFPWHVGIYRKNNDTEYEQICGGSLINNNLVISAAHCFYNDANNKLHDASEYAVAGGKHYRAWNVGEEYSQNSTVEYIHLPGRYQGQRGNFAEDIALVKMKTPFQLSALVFPICIDWHNVERDELRAGQSGKIKQCTGWWWANEPCPNEPLPLTTPTPTYDHIPRYHTVSWGRNIHGESTPILHEIDLPYVPFQECRRTVPVDFLGYLTPDKFCAGHLNAGSGVCDGNGGNGLCFQKEEDQLWYLRGVASVSPVKNDSCDYNMYTTFTSVTNFRDWILEAYVNS